MNAGPVSCLYEGYVQHARRTPRRHAFRYRLQLFYLDLDELPSFALRPPLWGLERAAAFSFRRGDFLRPTHVPLAQAVRQTVAAALHRTPRGPVRLLAQVRTWGCCFNPLALYFCHDERGQLDAVVAEVTNTPWGERHPYVLDAAAADADARGMLEFQFAKTLHVSPFLPLDYRYAWRLLPPGERLVLRSQNLRAGQTDFSAALVLRRRPLTRAALVRSLWRHPFAAQRSLAAIYWQALRLWIKRCPFYPHPRTAPTPTPRTAPPSLRPPAPPPPVPPTATHRTQPPPLVRGPVG